MLLYSDGILENTLPGEKPLRLKQLTSRIKKVRETNEGGFRASHLLRAVCENLPNAPTESSQNENLETHEWDDMTVLTFSRG